MENPDLKTSNESINSMSELDILTIDTRIRKSFEIEYSLLSKHDEKLQELEDSLKTENLRRNVRELLVKARDNLLKHIEEIRSLRDYNLYLVEAVPYIEEYKEIMKTPIKVSFMGKKSKNDRQKCKVVEHYLEVASKYMNIKVDKNCKSHRIVCLNCSNKKDFDVIDNNIYICTNCYARQTVMIHNSSYNDIDRVNISTKYMYDPKIHFRDCIKQYQGKQNCTIPQKVYDELEEQFKRHHLLMEEKNTKDKFAQITKNHIMIFLKELDYPKHYENVHLIHYNITGKKPDDISYLEDKLLDDFDLLIDLYHKKFKNIKRKNFINTQYVLYQLLCHHRHPCKKEEFIILKTVDRKFFHDEICKTLFEELGLILAQVA